MGDQTYYLDTNVIFAYAIQEDNCHKEAKQLINSLGKGEFYTSTYTLVELHTFISRESDEYNLPFLNPEISLETKIKATIKYCLRELEVVILSDEHGTKEFSIGRQNVQIYNNFSKAIEFSPRVDVTSRDIMHIGHIGLLHDDVPITTLVSLDKDFDDIDSELGELANLNVITPS